MKKIIIPDGVTLAMDEAVFDQDPRTFIRLALGSLVLMRIANNEADRLNLVFGRACVQEILTRDNPTWQDYQNLVEWCI